MNQSAEVRDQPGVDDATHQGGGEEARHGLTDTVEGAEAGSGTAGDAGKDPERRKSGRRRSGFSRGRVSLTQLSRDTTEADTDQAGGKLHRQIPVELPAAERLSLLSRLILRHTLEVLDKEFEDVPGFDNVKAEAVMGVGATIDQMESDGSFQQACTTQSLAFNPVNLQMENTIIALTSCIKRLEEEDSDWSQLVDTLESQADGAKRQLKQLDADYGDLPDDVKQLSLTFLPQHDLVLDLSAVSTDTVRDVKTISLLTTDVLMSQMDDYCHSVDLLKQTHTAAAKHMDVITTALDEAVNCKQCDPRESIQQLLAS
ncbi:hypothetical protein ACOMHN_039103 [Nucella lapillus]